MLMLNMSLTWCPAALHKQVDSTAANISAVPLYMTYVLLKKQPLKVRYVRIRDDCQLGAYFPFSPVAECMGMACIRQGRDPRA